MCAPTRAGPDRTLVLRSVCLSVCRVRPSVSLSLSLIRVCVCVDWTMCATVTFGVCCAQRSCLECGWNAAVLATHLKIN